MSPPADKLTRLLRLGTAIVIGEWGELERLRAGAPAGEPDRAWRETYLQAHLFCGFPRTVEAGEVLLRAGGLGQPAGDELDSRGDAPAGARLFDTIYAADAESVRGRLGQYHPSLACWIADHAYGRVLARPGLDGCTRELLAVCALAATSQHRQLASHARGARRLGASGQDLRASLEAVSDLLPQGTLDRGLEVIARFAGSE